MRAIIGGTGFYRMTGMAATRRQVVRTPYGQASGALTFGRIDDCAEVVFLNRHGYGHTLAPHLINYRANLWALREVGVRQVIAVASAGSLVEDIAPGSLVLPDQLIDYTSGRAHTFVDSSEAPVVHVDMTEPYTASLRVEMLRAAQACGVRVTDGGTYACTQGPRLETAAEVRRLRNDGCDLVGMTGMPEAALARELGLEYCALNVVSNYAAGVGESHTRVAFEGGDERYNAAMQHMQHLLGTWCAAPGALAAGPGDALP
ncbi:S-methyl-5'-thioinosine phosphorylase [Verticiella sediminum]|uniref:Probable 6-oxopurine nucleoside phosphorylase n=1 Tax=Verticiella sediminum TaxID=1247510 RepID=A0A556ABP7_9BURK|nr:S-methyl-5'-thioinosine phosphorylase [Verticiella sediminum]TSH90319.1 S-methyl-5'-thioinosine phosphorylase [Verticiella sediminum]